MKRKIIWFVVLAAIAALAVAGFRYRDAHKPPDITYNTVPAKNRRITAGITASGTLSALVTVQVGAQISGRIQALYADFNSIVKKGEVIAKIDPQLFQAAAEQARASFESAQANVTKAEAVHNQSQKQLLRTQALREKGLASQQDLEAAEANAASDAASVEVGKAALLQARANANQAQVNLSYTIIRAPFDGVVISRSVDVGQTVAASLSAPTIFTIAESLAKMQVDTNVSEGDVGRLTSGMAATFTVDAFAGKTFKGVIREVRNAPTTVQNVVTYDAVINVANDELKLKPGMTANVNIVYAERKNVLTIPNSAIRFKPANLPMAAPNGSRSPDAQRPAASVVGQRPGGGMRGRVRNEDGTETKILWVLRGGTPSDVTLKLGLSDGTYTEVVSGGLKEGDLVITEQVGGAKPSAPSGPGMQRLF